MTDIFMDVPTEWRALGALLDDRNASWMNRISPGLFAHKDTIDTFHAMQTAYIKHGEITYEGIKALNNGKVPGQLSAAQGGNIRAIVDELARMAKKRQAARVGAHLRELANEHDPSLEKIQAALLFDPILAEEDSSIVTGAQHLLADLALKQSGAYSYVRSGLGFIDNSLGGEWKPRATILLAASPGSGKTTLVAQSMLNMAKGYINEKTGELIVTPSLFFSLEMAKEDLWIKWAGNQLNIDTRHIQSGNLSAEQYKQVEDIIVSTQQLPMYVIENDELLLSQYIYEIKKHITHLGVKVVFIDYLQIVNHKPTGNKSLDFGEFVQAMKALAKREGITIVILSQITDGNEGTFRARWSGDVGSVVDAMFEMGLDTGELLPPGYKNVKIDRLKNRFGPTGTTAVYFNGPYQRFEEYNEQDV